MNRIVLALVSLCMLSLITPLAVNAASSASFPSIAQGETYGSYASVATGQTLATSGPTAALDLACHSTPGTLTSSTDVSLGSLAGIGTVQSSIITTRTATDASVQVTSTIKQLNLLGGLITAQTIQATSFSTASSAGATTTASFSFTNINVAGTPQTPAPNTYVNLPEVGYVVLNEQFDSINGPTATQGGLYAMDIYITLGPFAGSRIVIGRATSGEILTARRGSLGASAYGLYATGQAALTSNPGLASNTSPLSLATTDCTGDLTQNSLAALNIPAVASSGVLNTTASGRITSSDISAIGQASISNLNLLGGLISADKIIITARADWNGTGSRSGTMQLTNAKAAGTSLSNSPAPNHRVNLPGIGYMVVNEQSGANDASAAWETAIAFDIYVTQSNLLGLSKGTHIVVGLATVNVLSY